MTRRSLIPLLLLAPLAPARAQTVDQSNGEAGATIFQLTTVPRAAALGGALVAADGIGSLFANPAGIASLAGSALHASGQTLFDGSKAGAVALGRKSGGLALALGARYLDLGSVDEVVCAGCGGRGTPTGLSLSAHEIAATGAAAVSLGSGLALGAAVNYYGTSLADSSGGALSFSAGARWPAAADAPLTLGASLQYLGGGASVAGFSSPMPTALRVGGEWRPYRQSQGSFHLSLAGDYVMLRGAPGRLEGGAEIGMVPPGGVGLLARIGYATGSAYDAASAITVGGGIALGRLSLDYAFQGSTAFGAMHRFGVTVGR